MADHALYAEILEREISGTERTYFEIISALFSSETLSEKLENLPEFELEEFFHRVIQTYDSSLDSESSQDFEQRKRDYAVDYRIGYKRRRKEEEAIDKKEDEEKEETYSHINHKLGESLFRKDIKSFLRWKMKQIERLLLEERYGKASLYSRHLVFGIMAQITTPSLFLDEKYALTLLWFGEAEMALGNYDRALKGSSFKDATSLSLLKAVSGVRQSFFQRFLEIKDKEIVENNEDNKFDISSAKIIVDSDGVRGVNESKQFIVNDVNSALKIAKKSDIIFLKKGYYDCSKESNKCLEIRCSVTIVGQSKFETVISGSIIKWETCASLEFRNLTILVGKPEEEHEDVVYLLGGKTILTGCVVESFANTAIYVIGKGETTELIATLTVFDGLKFCQRIICPCGPKIQMLFDNCYACDSFSFLTFIDFKDPNTDSSYTFVDSVFKDLHDGILFLPQEGSNLNVFVSGCQFDLVKLNNDSQGTGIFVDSRGSVEVKANIFFFHDIDSEGVHLVNVTSARVLMNYAEVTSEYSRAMALSEGFTLVGELEKVILRNNEIIGARIGYNLSVKKIEEKESLLFIENCSAKSCSIGLYFEPQFSSKTRNICLEATEFKADTCHYGIMINYSNSSSLASLLSIKLNKLRFSDVPRSILVYKDLSSSVSLQECEFMYTRDFDSMAPYEEGTDRRSKMYLYFASEENIPHRLAFDKDKFYSIDSERDVDSFQESSNVIH